MARPFAFGLGGLGLHMYAPSGTHCAAGSPDALCVERSFARRMLGAAEQFYTALSEGTERTRWKAANGDCGAQGEGDSLSWSVLN